jgi:hypothetical protein
LRERWLRKRDPPAALAAHGGPAGLARLTAAVCGHQVVPASRHGEMVFMLLSAGSQ